MGTYVGHSRAIRIRMETRMDAMADLASDCLVIAAAAGTLRKRGSDARARGLDTLLDVYAQQLATMRVWQERDRHQYSALPGVVCITDHGDHGHVTDEFCEYAECVCSKGFASADGATRMGPHHYDTCELYRSEAEIADR